MKIFLLLLLFISCQCNSQPIQDCKNLPDKFPSFYDANEQIQHTQFKISETLDTRKSSWIKGLSFLSCNGLSGFLIMKAGGKTYVHQDVPINIWRELSTAHSFGSYYDKNIKFRYQLQLNK